jgi:peptide/nickel transport system substrate-binding protein
MIANPRHEHSASAAVALAAVLMLACIGCGSGDSTSQGGGTAVLGSISDVDSWNEYLSQQSFAGNLLRRIFLRLAQKGGEAQDGPLSFTPALAESWEFSEDGLALTFKLREAVWSDGVPITASDVRFTWLAQTSPDIPWAGAASKEHITDVEVVDDCTVTFHFDADYPYQLADAVEGGILPEHYFGEVPFEQWTSHDWSGIAIGSGPFLLHSHSPGQETVLVRNPHYYKEGYPLLDRVVVRYVPDINNLLTQLLAGDIDYLEGVPPRDAHRLADNPDITVIPFDYPAYDYIGWNGSSAPFDDPALRLAMTLAIDRRALVEDLLYGYGRVSKGPLPSSYWGADRDLQPWPYDPEQARRILAQSGYSTSDNGRRLEFELLTNSGNRLREEMLVKIQEQLSRIGVVVRARPLEMRTMREKVMTGEYDAYLGSWVFVGKVEIGPFFGSTAVPPHGYNVVFYRSPEVDRLLDQLHEATDWQSSKPILDSIRRRIHRDQPYTFLYEAKRVVAHGPRLRGVLIDIPADPLARLERFRIATP